MAPETPDGPDRVGAANSQVPQRTGSVALQAHHRQALIERGITPEVIAARGYTTTVLPGWLRQVGFSIGASKQVPGLVIPIRDVHGDQVFYQYRPDQPRTVDGKPRKYELPQIRNVIDVPALARDRLNAVAAPLWVTEGPLKADAAVSAGVCCIGLFGVWGWRGKARKGSATTILTDWEYIALKGRMVYLAPDSDVATKPHVAQAMSRLGRALEARGADVRYVAIPGKRDGRKVGLDDYLAGGGSLDDLAAYADEEPPTGSRVPLGEDGKPRFKGADDRFTDAVMAETVSGDVLADRFLWVAGLGWLAWDGRRWERRSDATVAEAIRRYVVDRFKGAVDNAHVVGMDDLDGWRSMMNGGRQRSVLTLARGIVERRVDELDADPDLLNTPAGVVDLRTGEVFPHAPDFLMTKLTKGSYRPGFLHRDWARALRALPRAERRWLQVRIGQAVTGHTTPDGILPVCQGSGENGKSLILTDGLVPALGDYASMASAKLLQATKGSEHSTERAELRGKRLLVAEELTEGRSIDVTALKQIQDVGQITARYIRQDNIEFTTSHSLFCTTNYVPVVNEVDHGTWRRLALLRFPYTFRKTGEELESPTDRRGDDELKAKVKANATGQHDAIVTWAVEGARQWHQEGAAALALTDAIRADTDAWRADADRIFGGWLELWKPDRDSCVVATESHAHFNAWLRDNGHNEWSRETFGPRFLQHAETIRHGVDEVRMARQRAVREGLQRRPDDRYRANDPLPAQVRVYRGVRYRGDDDENDR
jgi:P4 family phage/plasmid primase-like protien